ncbi:MAG: sialate O-acetylesterase [Gemmataceae bacterium]|nr:sialate O-acetylesterase [Gemmataceae bacterium]
MFRRSLLLSLLMPYAVDAEVRLPAIFGSHMVVQRGAELPVWGWAAPNEEVTVQFDNHRATTKADAEGRWRVKLPALEFDRESHKLTVRGSNTIELTDILIGDVWLGSGQSNMEWPLRATQNGAAAVAAADHPRIRLFHVPKVQAKEPAEDLKAEWKVCTPTTVAQFSAVLYYFGRRLEKELDVPIGLINSSWGGSPIEPWTITRNSSGAMYNGMIAPLIPFPIAGVIWYQGETNVMQRNGMKYRDKMEDLISGWRRAWDKNFPFYFVQIAPWQPKDRSRGYAEGELPALWEAQAAALKIPGTGMVVTTDLVDNIEDIHPQNKLDVGNRLALWALAKTYDRRNLVYSGPLYKSMSVEGDKIRLHFAHVGSGLASRDGKPLTEFEIAGDDDQFVAADAVIEGDTVVVSSPTVKQPTQVRFGWRTTANPNFMNKEGLPASPFRTKGWRGGTGE